VVEHDIGRKAVVVVEANDAPIAIAPNKRVALG